MSDYPMVETSRMSAMNMDKRATLRERLEENKRQIQERLVEVQAALDMLNKHPEFEEFHNAIGKVGY